MRYLTVVIRPTEEGAFHPLGRTLTDDPSLTREAIHHVELLDDDTVLLFAEGSGDRRRYEEIMAAAPSVVDYLVSGTGRWLAMSQFEATDRAERLLEHQRESDVVVETPIRFTADGALRVTYLGDDPAFQSLVEDVAADTGVEFEVVETGAYDPDETAFTRLLTARQREVLEAAVDVGYYSAPRQSTHEDVAERVGIAPTTAGEHLRKIEARVFDALVR